MWCSDVEEGEVVPPLSVTSYLFEDRTGAAPVQVSFAVLPVLFDGDEIPVSESGNEVFLQGTASSGGEKVCERAVAWRLGCEDVWPEVSVMTKGGGWVKLVKPWKPYLEGPGRTILVTVSMIHFLKRKPESSLNRILFHLNQVFSLGKQPSIADFNEHLVLINEFFERDEVLAKSSLSYMLRVGRPTSTVINEDVQNEVHATNKFIADGEVHEVLGQVVSDESEDEWELFDSVCAICDNGGDILCCEGRCMRSFHATREAGNDSKCKSLGYSTTQVEQIKNFLCKNCKYQQHQCFACGTLGSSDKSVGAEVFPCVNATCGHFYHPKCIARLLYRCNEAEATECQKKIEAGESFICSAHKCVVCNEGEDKTIPEWQFAMCRRCPKSYHRRCLPRKISFHDIEEEGIQMRAWDGLLQNRILIYCLKHEMDQDLGTPTRNHLKFPEIERKKVVLMKKSKAEILIQKKVEDSNRLPVRSTSQDLHNSLEHIPRSFSQEGDEILPVAKRTTSKVEGFNNLPVTSSSRGLHNYLEHIPRSISQEVDEILPVVKRTTSKEMKRPLPLPSRPTSTVRKTSFPVICDETMEEMKALWDEASASVTLEEIMKKRTMPSTHASFGGYMDKSITLGKIEGSVEAVRSAIKKLEDGGSIEDAKAVCQPEVFKNLLKWNRKLKVYLAPFLYGSRYTSFGRHFTKVNKLMEIVEKLQWYVQDGDTVVDFCCGANDFSQLMKETLDAAGKECSYKNYDIIQPKNDFCFEKRDWMTVETEDLPDGSQLIMGLNPPFGVNGGLANEFINKALTFKPKLVILIVPPCTERLDRKRPAYDLIWEDFRKLEGKSFYLPGSVDVEGKQMDQWNNTAPVLYLWSRQDFTQRHMDIALQQGHITSESPSEDMPPEWMTLAPPATYHLSEAQETMREGKNTDPPCSKRSPDNHTERWGWKPRRLETIEEASNVKEEGDVSKMSISPTRHDGYGRMPGWGRHHVPGQLSSFPQQNSFSASGPGMNPPVFAQQGQYPAPPPWPPCHTPPFAIQGPGVSYRPLYLPWEERHGRFGMPGCPPYPMGFAPRMESRAFNQQARYSTPYSGYPGFAPANPLMQQYGPRIDLGSTTSNLPPGV